jgi:hypothetical protein
VGIHFHQIVQRLEEVLRTKYGKKKILNKEIASELELSPKYFAVIKKRGKIPYLALALFAQRERINLNWLLLGAPPKRLCSTDESAA